MIVEITWFCLIKVLQCYFVQPSCNLVSNIMFMIYNGYESNDMDTFGVIFRVVTLESEWNLVLAKAFIHIGRWVGFTPFPPASLLVGHDPIPIKWALNIHSVFQPHHGEHFISDLFTKVIKIRHLIIDVLTWTTVELQNIGMSVKEVVALMTLIGSETKLLWWNYWLIRKRS